MVTQIDLEDEEHRKKSDIPFALHISEGNKHFRLSQFNTAIFCFNSVLKFDPTNVQSLIGRAKCFIRLGQYNEAKESAAAMLLIHPKCAEAFYIKGEAEYFLGNCEQGLKDFLNGLKIRPKFRELRHGYELCRKTLSNFDSKVLPSVDADDVKQLSQEYKIGKSSKIAKSSKQSNRNPVFIRSLYTDLKFTEALLEDDSMGCAYSACQDLRTFLNRRTRFWRSQNQSTAKKPAEKINLESAKLLLQECEKYFLEGDIEACILRGFDTVEYLNSLPNRGCRTLMMKARVFHLMGVASIRRNEFSSAIEYFSRELKIGEELNISKLRYKAWRSIGEVNLMVQRFVDAKEALKNCLECLESGEESILWYKIADCEMNCGLLENAVDFAEKAGVLAEEGQDYRLQFDVKMLLAEIAMKGKKTEDAKRMYQDALKIAIQNSDPRLDKIKSLLELFDSGSIHDFKFTNYNQVSKNTENSFIKSIVDTNTFNNKK